MTAFVLIHSPLVGPATWRWVAAELEQLGHPAVVPSLRGVESRTAGWAKWCADAVAAQVPDEPLILVGHSGAGPLLPLAARRIEARRAEAAGEPVERYVFVDATIPPTSGDARPAPRGFRSFLEGLATDGTLPPWSEWWGEDVMVTLVPDADRRRVVEAELPRLPLRYFDERIEVPQGWTRRPCSYLLFSEPYREEATDAARRGWPSREAPGGHLQMVTDPTAVARCLIEVTD